MFQHGEFKIDGTSVSGVATCLVVHPYKIAIDIGVCTPEAAKCPWVFITHAHIDHMGAAAQHAALRDMQGMSPTKFVCSAEVASGLRQVLDIWQAVQGTFKYEIVILNPGERLLVGRGIWVHAFSTFHRMPSQGYAFSRIKTSLKPEFVGLSGEEIGKLVRSGIPVRDEVEVAEIVFTGDSQVATLENHFVRRTKIVVAEATFIDDKVTVAEAQEKGHTHLDEIVAHQDWLANCERVVLTHCSARYGADDIAKAVAKLPEGLRERVRTI